MVVAAPDDRFRYTREDTIPGYGKKVIYTDARGVLCVRLVPNRYMHLEIKKSIPGCDREEAFDVPTVATVTRAPVPSAEPLGKLSSRPVIPVRKPEQVATLTPPPKVHPVPTAKVVSSVSYQPSASTPSGSGIANSAKRERHECAQRKSAYPELSIVTKTSDSKVYGTAVLRGVASWYGKDFHGKTMRYGDVYDMCDPRFVAMNNLPEDTIIEVTNPENGRSTLLVVKDTGSFDRKYGRTMDLSYAAAEKLGFVDKGVTTVTYRIIQLPTPKSKMVIASIMKQKPRG